MQKKKVWSFVLSAALLCTPFSTFAATGTVTTDALNIRIAPTTEAEILGKSYSGEQLNVTKREGSWYLVNFNGQAGYASADYVSLNVIGDGVVTTDVLNIRTQPSTSAEVMGQFVQGDVCSVTGTVGEWTEILIFGQIGYIHSDYVTLRSSAPTVNRSRMSNGSGVVAYAEQYLGTPYRSGGSTPAGFDCSGFTSYVYSQFGVSLGHSSAGQASAGIPVSKSELQPGDLVFFNTNGGGISHVGIYAGNGQMIHATVPGDVVKYSSINTAYYSSRYVTARRVMR